MNPKVVDCRSGKNISIKLQTCAKHDLLSSMSIIMKTLLIEHL